VADDTAIRQVCEMLNIALECYSAFSIRPIS